MDKATKKELEQLHELRRLATMYRNQIDGTSEKGQELQAHFNAVIDYVADLLDFYRKGH